MSRYETACLLCMCDEQQCQTLMISKLFTTQFVTSNINKYIESSTKLIKISVFYWTH